MRTKANEVYMKLEQNKHFVVVKYYTTSEKKKLILLQSMFYDSLYLQPAACV